MNAESLWVVIAAYNEAEVIHQVVQSVRARYPNVVVVDDCSVDGTLDAARNAGAVVLRHAVNLGQGAALQTGIAFALRQGAELVATFDGDGQHDIADLERMIDLQRSSRADCVLGSRFLGSTEEMPGHRAVILKAAVLYTRLTSGLKVSDAHNGFRLLTRRAAPRHPNSTK